MIAHRRIAHPADGHAPEVSRRHVLAEGEGIRPDHLDLAFAGHVPQRDPFDERPVLLIRVAERPRHVHVVVDGDMRETVAHKGVEERRLSDPGPEPYL